MSASLIKRWRRAAREWNDVADRGGATQLAQPAAADPVKIAAAGACARILNECADSLERSMRVRAKPRNRYRTASTIAALKGAR